MLLRRANSTGVATRDEKPDPAVAPAVLGLVGDCEIEDPFRTDFGAGERRGVLMMLQVWTGMYELIVEKRAFGLGLR